MGSVSPRANTSPQLDRPFVDTDNEVERMLVLADISPTGEPAFREAEQDACQMPFAQTHHCARHRWGTPCAEGAMEWMQKVGGGPSASLDVLLSRLSEGQAVGPSTTNADRISVVERMMLARAACYARPMWFTQRSTPTRRWMPWRPSVGVLTIECAAAVRCERWRCWCLKGPQQCAP